MTNKLIEAMARALEHNSQLRGWVSYESDAAAVLKAISDAGYAVVPDDTFGVLDAAMIAIDDWLHTYAADECRIDYVVDSRARIFEAGGTLGYIADVQKENRRVLKEIWNIKNAIEEI